MKNDGFTLIELIAVIMIIGIVSLFGLPAVRNAMDANNSNSCMYYERAMKEAARNYIQKESTDIFENPSLGGAGYFPSSYTLSQATLISEDYLSSYNDSRTTISNASVVVTYNSSNKTFYYTTKMTCRKKNGQLLYSH